MITKILVANELPKFLMFTKILVMKDQFFGECLLKFWPMITKILANEFVVTNFLANVH